MALTWDDKSCKDQSGKIVCMSYRAQLSHWGTASVHTHIHSPGEAFLDCLGLGIEMHPLGRTELLDALNPAETVLLKALRQQAEWCLEAMVDIGTPGDP